MFYLLSVVLVVKKMDIFIVHFIKWDEDLGVGTISSSTLSYRFIARTPESDGNLARANNLGFSFPFATGSVSN